MVIHAIINIDGATIIHAIWNLTIVECLLDSRLSLQRCQCQNGLYRSLTGSYFIVTNQCHAHEEDIAVPIRTLMLIPQAQCVPELMRNLQHPFVPNRGNARPVVIVAEEPQIVTLRGNGVVFVADCGSCLLHQDLGVVRSTSVFLVVTLGLISAIADGIFAAVVVLRKWAKILDNQRIHGLGKVIAVAVLIATAAWVEDDTEGRVLKGRLPLLNGLLDNRLEVVGGARVRIAIEERLLVAAAWAHLRDGPWADALEVERGAVPTR